MGGAGRQGSKGAWLESLPDILALSAASAAQILQSLGPLVEIGCGCGYWARLLRERGVDVLAFDHKLPPKKERWTELAKGGPEALGANSARTLMLCYPDDFEDSEDSMAVRCLRNYTGDTIVHIGEMLGETYCLPSPWGRTTDAEFQVSLHLPLLWAAC